MKKVVIFFCSMLAIIAILIAAVPFFLTADFAGEQLKSAVLKQTGRELAFNGKLRFKFWPNVMVEANDAVLSNPPQMFKGQFAAIKKLRVRVAAMPLLSRKIIIKELTLINPRLGLVVDGKGRTNWTFANGPAETTSNNGKQSNASQNNSQTDDLGIKKVKLAPLVIKNGDVRFLDERSGSAFAAKNVNMTIKLARLSGPVNIKGNLVWNNQKISLTSFVKRPVDLAGRGSPIDLTLKSKLLDFQFNGRAKLDQGLALAGKIATKTPSIRKLARYVGSPLAPGKGLGRFSAKANIDLTAGTIKLTKSRIAIDNMNARGALSVSLGGKRPSIIANIGMDKIDVNQYLQPAKNKPKAQAKAKAKTKRGWNNQRFDFSGLKAVDAKLSIATSQILYQDVVIGSSQLTANLKNGVLNAKLGKMAFYDGNAAGQIILNGAKKVPSLAGTLSANGLNAFRLLKDFADFKRLEGKGQIQLSLASLGASQRQMVKNLAGTAKLRFTNGSIRGVNLAAMVRNVQKSILSGWNKKSANKNTDFSEFSMSYKIAKGIAKSDDLRLLGPLVRISGKGSVNLPQKRINYRVEPKLVATLKGQGGAKKLKGIAVPVIAKGPWENPKIYPDIKGILGDPQAAFKKLNTLLSSKTGTDLNKAKKKIQKKAIKKVEKVLGKKIDKKKAAKTGKKLLKGLLGKQKKSP